MEVEVPLSQQVNRAFFEIFGAAGTAVTRLALIMNDWLRSSLRNSLRYVNARKPRLLQNISIRTWSPSSAPRLVRSHAGSISRTSWSATTRTSQS
eukprot:6705529-Pyramimonas_sp.AAC.1